MDKELFWKMIETARKKSGNDLDLMHDILLENLMKLSAKDIYSWGQYYSVYHQLSETGTLYMAAYVTGNGGDDSFEYFRGWLISRGHKVFMDALADPDSLARLRISPGDRMEFEEMMGMGYEAYADKLNETGEEPVEMELTDAETDKLRSEIVFADDSGLDTEDACIRQIPVRLPRLCKKFGYEADEMPESHDSGTGSREQNDEAAQLAAILERNASQPGHFTVTSDMHASYTPRTDRVMPALDKAGTITNLHIRGAKHLEDISHIADFTKVKRVDLDGFDEPFSSLADFSIFEKLPRLESLDISDIPLLTNLDFIRYMPRLSRLCVHSADALEDISAIEGLSSLETLIIIDCPGIKAIPSMAASAATLKVVRILDCKGLESIEGLRGLSSVADLWLHNNRITDISPLEGFTHLNYLDLSRNMISNIEALKHLSHLETLDLSRNKIDDITPLGNLRFLKNLFLSGNKITDICPLGGLKEIVYSLDLSKNKGLSDISPLKGKKLGGLELKGTAVTDFSAVEHIWYIDLRDR